MDFFSNRIPTNHKHENHILNIRSRTSHCHIYILTHFFPSFIKHMVMKLCAHHFFSLVLYLLIGFYLDNKHSQKRVYVLFIWKCMHICNLCSSWRKRRREQKNRWLLSFQTISFCMISGDAVELMGGKSTCIFACLQCERSICVEFHHFKHTHYTHYTHRV